MMDAYNTVIARLVRAIQFSLHLDYRDKPGNDTGRR